MKTAEKNKLIRDTLKWVNAVRKATGRKPLARMPKGFKDEPLSCPIASALNTKYKAEVNGSEFFMTGITSKQASNVLNVLGSEDEDVNDYEYQGQYTFFGPAIFDEFVGAFDDGLIPELIREEK